MLHTLPMANDRIGISSGNTTSSAPVEESAEGKLHDTMESQQQNRSVDQPLQDEETRAAKPIMQTRASAAIPIVPTEPEQHVQPRQPTPPAPQPNYAHYVPPPQQYYDYGFFQGQQQGYQIPAVPTQPLAMPGGVGYQQSVPFGFNPGSFQPPIVSQAHSWPPQMMYSPEISAPQQWTPPLTVNPPAWAVASASWEGQIGAGQVETMGGGRANAAGGDPTKGAQVLHQPGPPIQMVADGHGPEGCNLFVFHIPNEMTNLDLYNFFSPFGNVISARIMVDNDTGRSRGFGFVSFDDAGSAEEAILHMNGLQIGKKRLKVQHKKDKGSYDAGYGPEHGKGKGKGAHNQSLSPRRGGGRGGGARSYYASRPGGAAEEAPITEDSTGEEAAQYLQRLNFGEVDEAAAQEDHATVHASHVGDDTDGLQKAEENHDEDRDEK